MGRVSLYYYTVKNMKLSQVINRFRIKMGKGCSFGVIPSENCTDVQRVVSPESLDFDPVFMSRFNVEELMENRISLLHSSKDMNWKTTWEFTDKSALWNFNLHYFEYLLPLVKAWKDTGEKRYIDKTIEIINGWIDSNQSGSRPAWASYTIALRIVTWVSYYGYVEEELPEDFRKKFLSSLHSQYVYLLEHLEKDILGNHYFEDLKSILIAAIFFKDDSVIRKAKNDFKAECKEEILPDGMHFELSPMYHKIIFEGMIRIALALKGAGIPDEEIESYLQPMLDVAYSFEYGLDRIPLFNDGGDNVAKSIEALVETTYDGFSLHPHFKSRLSSSGFYIFEKTINDHRWKLIVDAGEPGPKYIPGHAHCDSMSYELFYDNEPILVNCGTFAYQCKERSFFRSTAAHNTVKMNGKEQSQCWGSFRLARRSTTIVQSVDGESITMQIKDAYGQRCTRTIKIKPAQIEVTDESQGAKLEVYVHAAAPINIKGSGVRTETFQPYAPEYGIKNDIICSVFSGSDKITHTIELKRQEAV